MRIRKSFKSEIPNKYLGSGTLEIKGKGIHFNAHNTGHKFFWSWEMLAENCECKTCTFNREKNCDGNIQVLDFD